MTATLRLTRERMTQAIYGGDPAQATAGPTVIRLYIDYSVTPYAVQNQNVTIYADATGSAGGLKIQIPPAAQSSVGTGMARITVIKTDASANGVIISPTGANTIGGAASLTLAAQYNKTTLTTGPDGATPSTTWYAI